MAKATITIEDTEDGQLKSSFQASNGVDYESASLAERIGSSFYHKMTQVIDAAVALSNIMAEATEGANAGDAPLSANDSKLLN